MSREHLPVRLELSDSFTGSMAAAAAAARDLNARWALREATWEPIDWSAD